MTAGVPFSILVPTRNRVASLRRALTALARQGPGAPPFEVVVADDGSTDGTCAFLASAKPGGPLRTVETGGRGRAAALNAALEAARGESVVLLDDDMEPVPTFLSAHGRALASAGRAGVVGAAPVVVGARAGLAARYVARRFERHLQKLADRRDRGDVAPADFYSGNFSTPRSLLAAVGGFDASFEIYGNEDRDLAMRLLAAGARLVYSPEALAHQHYEKSARELIADHHAKGRTAVLFARKHRGPQADAPFRSYSRGSAWRRAARRALLAGAATRPSLDALVLRAGGWLERHDPPGALPLLSVLLDYAFWRGARAAERELAIPADGVAPTEAAGRG